jgi:hypothetical protein
LRAMPPADNCQRGVANPWTGNYLIVKENLAAHDPRPFPSTSPLETGLPEAPEQRRDPSAAATDRQAAR